MRKTKENKAITLVALVIVLIIITSGVSVYATQKYLASQVTYKEGKTVEYALNELYNISNSDLIFYKKNSSTGSQTLNRVTNIELEKGKYLLTINEYNAAGYHEQGLITTAEIALNSDVEVEKISEIVSSSQKNKTASSYLSIYKINVTNDTTLVVTGKDCWDDAGDGGGLNYIVTKLN